MQHPVSRPRPSLGPARALAAFALAAGLFGLSNRPAEAATLVVGSGPSCKKGTFSTIAAAVAAANNGDTIEICPGTYPENVTIDKSIKLLGPAKLKKKGRACDQGGTDPSRFAIVDGSSEAGTLNVVADGVTISGLTVQNNDAGPGLTLAADTSGHTISSNFFQHNVFGLYLNGDGDSPSTVSQNCFRGNNRPGPANGNGIYSDQGVSRVTIGDNTFRGHESASMIFVAPPNLDQDQLTIVKNVARDDSAWIFANLTNSSIRDNTLLDSVQSGIFFGGGSSDVMVQRNTILRSAFSGINVRFQPGTFNVNDPNTDLTIAENLVERSGDWGIAIRDGSSDNTIRLNKSNRNGIDGLFASSGSTGNRFQDNTAESNTEHDCHDDTTDSGTAGTANTWLANQGSTAFPAGICANRRR